MKMADNTPEQPRADVQVSGSDVASEGLYADASALAPTVALDARDLACLTAATKHGLMRRNGSSLTVPSSRHPGVGWWARSSWSAHQVDAGQGGPWSVERVEKLCELGLLGVSDKEPSGASVTKAGKKTVKPPRSSATRPLQHPPGRPND